MRLRGGTPGFHAAAFGSARRGLPGVNIAARGPGLRGPNGVLGAVRPHAPERGTGFSITEPQVFFDSASRHIAWGHDEHLGPVRAAGRALTKRVSGLRRIVRTLSPYGAQTNVERISSKTADSATGSKRGGGVGKFIAFSECRTKLRLTHPQSVEVE